RDLRPAPRVSTQDLVTSGGLAEIRPNLLSRDSVGQALAIPKQELKTLPVVGPVGAVNNCAPRRPRSPRAVVQGAVRQPPLERARSADRACGCPQLRPRPQARASTAPAISTP